MVVRRIDLVNSHATTDVPSSIQRRTEYTAEGVPLYIGYAYWGADQSDNVWTIFKISYDANNQEILKQTAFDSWTNREWATYQ